MSWGWPLAAGLLASSALGCRGAPPLRELPYAQSFDQAPLGSEWHSRGGGWDILEGRLYNDGAHNVPLWLDARLPRDVRVTFTAESQSPEVDLKFEIFGDGDRHASGYVVILSGWNNSKSIIARLDEHGPEQSVAQQDTLRSEHARDPEGSRRTHADAPRVVARRHRAESNRRYTFRFERRAESLQLFVDDELHLFFFDPAPLEGAGHDRFAFSNWASRVWFDDLRIEAL